MEYGQVLISPDAPKPTGKDGKLLKAWRKARAERAQQDADERSPMEQIARLDAAGYTATKERKKLALQIANRGRKIEKVEVSAEVPATDPQPEKKRRRRGTRGRGRSKKPMEE